MCPEVAPPTPQKTACPRLVTRGRGLARGSGLVSRGRGLKGLRCVPRRRPPTPQTSNPTPQTSNPTDLWLLQLLRQYLYFCISKARRLRVPVSLTPARSWCNLRSRALAPAPCRVHHLRVSDARPDRTLAPHTSAPHTAPSTHTCTAHTPSPT